MLILPQKRNYESYMSQKTVLSMDRPEYVMN